MAGSASNVGRIAVADVVTAFSGAAKGNFAIGGTLTNTGVAQIAGSGIGDTPTIMNYVGQNGTVLLNTFLGGDGTSLEIGGGIVARISNNVSLYTTGGYTAAPGNEKRDSIQGNLGVRVIW